MNTTIDSNGFEVETAPKPAQSSGGSSRTVYGQYAKGQPQPEGGKPKAFIINPRSFMKGGTNHGVPAYLLQEDEWRKSWNMVFDYDRAKALPPKTLIDTLVASESAIAPPDNQNQILTAFSYPPVPRTGQMPSEQPQLYPDVPVYDHTQGPNPAPPYDSLNPYGAPLANPLAFCGLQNNWTLVDNLPYVNSGNNTTGFTPGANFGVPDTFLFASVGGVLVTQDVNDSGFDLMPAFAGGDFQVAAEVYSNGPVTDFYIMFVDASGERGFAAHFCPSATDTPFCIIASCCLWNQHGDYPNQDGSGFFSAVPVVGDFSSTVETTDFISDNWTPVVFSRVGGVLSLVVGSQVIGSYALGSLGYVVGQIGIGCYNGGSGTASFRNIAITHI